MKMSARFTDALVYAAAKHDDQTRKGTTVPYVAHVLAVASIALEHGASEDEAIAALLHDVVEDQGGPHAREEIRQRFGEAVAAIVDGCTDTDETPKPPWLVRKQAYLAHVPHASPSVLLVSAADKLHNARAILRDYRETGDAVWNRFKANRDQVLWYYRSLVEAFRARGSSALIGELDRVVTELEQITGAEAGKREERLRPARKRARAGGGSAFDLAASVFAKSTGNAPAARFPRSGGAPRALKKAGRSRGRTAGGGRRKQ